MVHVKLLPNKKKLFLVKSYMEPKSLNVSYQDCPSLPTTLHVLLCYQPKLSIIFWSNMFSFTCAQTSCSTSTVWLENNSVSPLTSRARAGIYCYIVSTGHSRLTLSDKDASFLAGLLCQFKSKWVFLEKLNLAFFFLNI